MNPLPYPGPLDIPDITINTITGAQDALDDGPWRQIAAADGQFDGYDELLQFDLQFDRLGEHAIEVRTFNSVGNMSESMTFPFLVTGISEPATGPVMVVGVVALRRRWDGRRG